VNQLSRNTPHVVRVFALCLSAVGELLHTLPFRSMQQQREQHERVAKVSTAAFTCFEHTTKWPCETNDAAERYPAACTQKTSLRDFRIQ